MASPLTTVVIPVKDEDPTTLMKFLYELDKLGYPVIVVDDGSKQPVLGADIRFDTCHGYGAALKAGIDRASTDLIVTADGDGQHCAYDVRRLEDFMNYFPHLAMVIGDRRLIETSLRRYLGRKFLNWLASLFAGRFIPDLNSGLRIFRRSTALGYFPVLCDTFSFTTSLTLCFMADNYPVDWLPIKVKPRQIGRSHVNLIRHGLITLRYILWVGIGLRTRRLRAWLRKLRLALRFI